MLEEKQVKIPADSVKLDGNLTIPKDAQGLVIFAHGNGSSRLSPRNTLVAGVLQKAGIGTLLFDLLTVKGRPGLREPLRYSSSHRTPEGNRLA